MLNDPTATLHANKRWRYVSLTAYLPAAMQSFGTANDDQNVK